MKAPAHNSKWNPDIADRICELLGSTQLGLVDVVEILRTEFGDDATPSTVTVQNWKRAHPEFKAAYKEARDDQAELLHDEAQKVAREPLPGDITKTVIKPDGTEVHTTRSDNVERSKLLVQTLLKRAGQLAPNKYGDKQQLEISGSLELADRLARARQRA